MQFATHRYLDGRLIEVGATWQGHRTEPPFTTTIRSTDVDPDQFVATAFVFGKQIFDTAPCGDVDAADRATRDELATRMQRLLAGAGE